MALSRCRVASAEGGRIETPTAPSGVAHEERCPIRNRLRGLRRHRDLPQRGSGRR